MQSNEERAIPKHRRCVVLGGCGFLGLHLVERLVRQEGYAVRVLDPHSRETPELQNLARTFPLELIAERSTNNTALLHEVLDGVDALFCFLGATTPAESTTNPLQDVERNLEENIRILEAAKNARVRKIIFPSSGGTVYGIPQQIPIPETHPTDPISSYGIVKLATEKYLQLYEQRQAFTSIMLRYGNPYGPGQLPQSGFGAIATFLECMALGKPIPMIGDGEMTRDFLYIDDAIDATLCALRYTGPERIFNIGSGVGTKISTLIPLIEEITGNRAEIAILPTRVSDVSTIVLDITKAREHLEWSPTTTLRAGLEKTWDWMKQRYGR